MAYITKKDNGRWLARITVPEQFDPETKKPSKTFNLKREAKAWARQEEQKIEAGTWPHGPEVAENDEMKLNELLDEWHEEYATQRLKRKTYNRYEQLIDTHIKPELGDYYIFDPSPWDIEAFLEDRMKNGNQHKNKQEMSRSTVNQMKSILSKAYKMARKKNYIKREDDPMPDVELPKLSDHKSRTKTSSKDSLNVDEANQLLSVAKEHSPYWFIYYEALFWGLRKGEALGARISDIDFENWAINLSQALYWDDNGNEYWFDTFKEDGDLTLYMIPAMVRHLKDWLNELMERQADPNVKWNDENDLLVPDTEGNPLRERNLDRDFDQLLDQAGLRDIRFHDLRRSTATMVFEQAPEEIHFKVAKTVSKRLQHSSGVEFTLDEYTDLDSDIERSVMSEALGDLGADIE